MGKIFCVEFQRVPLKFHTKYLTHILINVDFIHGEDLRALKFKSSEVFLKRSPGHVVNRGWTQIDVIKLWFHQDRYTCKRPAKPVKKSALKFIRICVHIVIIKP